MIELLDKLNKTLSNFNNNSEEKGCDMMNKFEELLAKYHKEASDITFETEGLSDDELEAKFAEMFEDKEPKNDDGEGADDGEGEGDNDPEPITTEEEACGKKKKKCSIDENGNMSVSFEISHEDIRGALFNLLDIYEEEDNEWYWITNVYDDYFIFENWDGNKLYKQSYSIDGDNVALSGDRQEVYKMILTESEKLAIDKMREEYAALVQFKSDAEAAQLQAQKDAIFAKEEFAVIVETKSFKKLIENSKDYTVEECEQRAKEILEDFNSFAVSFSAQDSVKKPKVLGFNFNKKEDKKSPYGNLFSK